MTSDPLDALLSEAQTRAGLMNGDDFPARVVETITGLRAEIEKWKTAWTDSEEKYDRTYAEWMTAVSDLRAAKADADRLAGALSALQSYGCPVCRGDCSSANPPVSRCPMRETESALASHNARKEADHDL